MSDLVKRNYNALALLAKLPVHTVNKSLKYLPDDTVNAIGEGTLNILCGNVPVSQSVLKTLKRRKRSLQTIANKRLPIKQRRRVISQTGGAILSTILGILLPTIASLIGSAVAKK